MKTRQAEAETGEDASERDVPSNSIVARNGGPVIFVFMVARVLDCAALVTLSLLSLIQSSSPTRHLSNELPDVLVHECMLASNVSLRS